MTDTRSTGASHPIDVYFAEAYLAACHVLIIDLDAHANLTEDSNGR